MSKVVGLRGLPVPPSSEPNADVVLRCEDLLRQACSGHLRGIAFVTMTAEDGLGTGWDGDADNRLLLSGAALLTHRIAKQVDES